MWRECRSLRLGGQNAAEDGRWEAALVVAQISYPETQMAQKEPGLLEIPAQYTRWSVFLNELPRGLGFSTLFVAFNTSVA